MVHLHYILWKSGAPRFDLRAEQLEESPIVIPIWDGGNLIHFRYAVFMYLSIYTCIYLLVLT